MAELFLDNVEVRGYRTFRELQVERFGRVNLLVGRNNAGKTSLLEAIRLYAQRGALSALVDILAARGEWPPRSPRSEFVDDLDPERYVTAFEQLFYGRRSSREGLPTLSVAPSGQTPRGLRVHLEWQRFARDLEAQRRGLLDLGTVDPLTVRIRPTLTVEFADEEPAVVPLDRDPQALGRFLSGDADAAMLRNTVSVPAGGIGSQALGRLWDTVTLTEYEDIALDALRIIAPSVRRLTFVGDRTDARRAVVRAEEFERPVLLGSMGDGMNRMLGIVLSLINARGGVLLVDEIENGVHYSVQQELWTLLFRTAKQLDVQVFASTHSWDCILAFQRAAAEDFHEEAALVRLEATRQGIRSILFGEHELAVVTRQHVEVR